MTITGTPGALRALDGLPNLRAQLEAQDFAPECWVDEGGGTLYFRCSTAQHGVFMTPADLRDWRGIKKLVAKVAASVPT